MSETLKPCPFCGRDVTLVSNSEEGYYIACDECGAKTIVFGYEAKAIEAWNKRVVTDKNVGDKERTAKVIEHDASVTDTDGYKYHRSEYLCGACKKKVIGGDEYCSHCGCRLDWNEDIPMEYFESGGI